MITRKDYNEALDVVEAYHKQLFTCSDSLRDYGKTKILDWDKLKECSTRLYNVLTEMSQPHYEIEYIEDFTSSTFLKHRNAGKKSWMEFERLRGY